jgi:N-acetylglucosaminyldiphosphoundecaprenol N-acetyl-beta-D-mannosaminyltransferase
MDLNTTTAIPDDLCRDVYCILGVPIDAIEMPDVLRRIEAAAANATPYLISTPNLFFLVNSQTDPEFRESLLLSDLCPADGMPIVWIARLIGIPIKKRIAGSDIFDAFKFKNNCRTPLKVFLFGGAEGVAEAACQALNVEQCSLHCVGSFYPGFTSVDEMSRDTIIDEINSSTAAFLIVSLGAKKGQSWLLRNHRRLLIPIRAHLGAAINFQAGTVLRSPTVMRRLGLEWLWRIKEEPYLWRRYCHDGAALLRLLVSRVLPLALAARWRHLRVAVDGHVFAIARVDNSQAVSLHISGYASSGDVPEAVAYFRDALASRQQIVIDLSETRGIDARFFGLLLMLTKHLHCRGRALKFTGVSLRLQRQFRLNGMEYLLSPK